MEKQCFLSQKGPKAVGPYSTAVEISGTVYLSGMLGICPDTGKLAEGDALVQAKQLFANLKTVLSEMDLSLQNVVKATVYLTSMGDFAQVNALYGEAFGKDFPPVPVWRYQNCPWEQPLR